MTKIVVKSKVKEAASTQVVVSSIEKKAAPYFKKLNRVSKVTKENFPEVGIQLKALKAIGKEAKEQQTTILSSVKETERLIKNLFKPFLDKVSEAEEEIKKLIEDYVADSEKKQKQVDTDFHSSKIKKISTYNNKMEEATIEKVKGGVSIKKIQKLFIVDENKIPRKFLVPDEVAIKEALQDGENIPGCELRYVNSISA